MTVDTREKLAAVYEAARFRPDLGIVIVALSLGTALLEGAGLGFLLPVIEVAQSSSPPENTSGFLGMFVRVYSFFGLPLTLEYLILGLMGVMSVRFGLSFLSSWLRVILSYDYQRHLKQQLFSSLVYGPIEYIDQAGSGELLNSVITETVRSAGIVKAIYNVLEVVLRGLVYLAIAAFLSPVLTLIALIGLSLSTVSVRYILEPAFVAGDEVAKANDRIQLISQTAIQGMREVRLLNMRTELVDRMDSVLGDYVAHSVKLGRNRSALNNLNQFTNALVVFVLVYVGFRFTGLSMAKLGVFLFAVFRLSPVVNQLNNILYILDGQLPHLVRVDSRLRELEDSVSPADNGDRPVGSVDRVEFDDVSFSYGDGDQILQDVSFSLRRGEKIAFVGPSGAGKSTIVSLLGRLRNPDSGRIFADDVPIDEIDAAQWRGRLAVVRQDPFLFDGTLRENITVSNRDASIEEVERVCEVARVSEFLPELPDGYQTGLGEDGVRLSGGQKQRVAIARALLKDADVLVLDEATSELDLNIERAVFEGIRSLEDQYATVSIAHRLSTVNDADRIYTLVDGSITEVGTHTELLDSDGVYADLYATHV